MRNYKSPITNEKIIELYQKGWSQKSIIDHSGVAVSYLRKVLKEAGFLTSSYRAITDQTKEIVIAFIYSGVPIQQIANYTDISFHVIREVTEKNHLQGVSSSIRSKKTDNSLPGINEERFEEVKALFVEGKMGLVKICEVLSIPPAEMVGYALHLNSFIKLHKRNMKDYILSLHKAGVPLSAISKQMNISRSIVKHVISEHFD